MGSIAAGVLLPDAMMKHYITRADIEAAIRSSNEERKAWDEARIAALKRGWSAFDFEDIFERIAGGMGINDAIAEVKENTSSTVKAAFNKIIIADQVLHEQYLRALQARALGVQDEIVDIADDDSTDVLHGEKGPVPNNAAVNRAKLRVETRSRLMGFWNPKLFGEQKNAVQVNVQVNHAERLEAARSRANNRQQQKIPAKVVEAAFRDVVPVETKRIPQPPKIDPHAEARRMMAEREANDLSWLDEPVKDEPLDTLWLEE